MGKKKAITNKQISDIKRLNEMEHMSRKMIAESIGVSTTTVGKILRGLVVPGPCGVATSFTRAQELANELGADQYAPEVLPDADKTLLREASIDQILSELRKRGYSHVNIVEDVAIVTRDIKLC